MSTAEKLADMEARKDAAYHERNRCVALIARMALALGCRAGVARTAIDGWSEDWHGCVYIDLPTGQVSWHFHDSQVDLFDGLPPYAGKWDGHDTPEKYSRVGEAYRAQPADDARPTIPASAPGAAESLAVLMRAIATKCRVGYVISKTINSNIRTAAEISAALNAGFAAAQPAADGAQRVERMSADLITELNCIDIDREDYELFSVNHQSVIDFARSIETNLAAAWGVKLDGEA